jgi:AcrR family transcriptional regulator
VGELDDTPARLVDAAERLFAEGGEEATSLRAITRMARSNAAAVHYHFGGRDELLCAVLERYLGPLTARRLDLLDDVAVRHGDPSVVTDLISAVVRPELELLAELRPHRMRVARLLGRTFSLPGPAVSALVEREFTTLAARIVPMLRACLTGVREEELRHRLRLVMGTATMLFGSAGSAPPLGTEDVEDQIRRLVTFCAGGMAAPPATAVPRKKRKKQARAPS